MSQAKMNKGMIFREAVIGDIPQMMLVRLSVRENILRHPALVTEADCEEYITRRGKGWVCMDGTKQVGFSIVDLVDNNVWALFLLPEYEGRGIGKRLHAFMLDWYFSQTRETLWLGTAPGTRAEQFYRRLGWTDTGLRPNGELRFEMRAENWGQSAF